jgi:hypothetical protein
MRNPFPILRQLMEAIIGLLKGKSNPVSRRGTMSNSIEG